MCFILKQFDFVITLVSVLKGVTKFILKVCLKSVSVKKFRFEQVPTSIYLLEKRSFLSLFPLDSAILLLIKKVAPLLEL